MRIKRRFVPLSAEWPGVVARSVLSTAAAVVAALDGIDVGFGEQRIRRGATAVTAPRLEPFLWTGWPHGQDRVATARAITPPVGRGDERIQWTNAEP
jgi:hypothetical protein